MIIGIDASRAATVQKTGTEAYAFQLISALIPLANARAHTVRLYFNQPPQTDFPNAEKIVIPFPRLWTHLRLAAELHRDSPDVFFTPAHVIPYTYRGNSVATVHDLGYEYFPEAHTSQQVRYLRWSTRHNATRSQAVLADSEATKRDLVTLYGIEQETVSVVYPALPEKLERVEGEGLTAVLTHHKISAPYFLYIGTIQPRKNLVRLIKAFLASDVPHQLVLAGKIGWQAQSILDAIPQDSSRILLTGFVPDDHKAALLSGATALLFPSLYEGFGFPILEAQSVGTPVLAATNSSMPEVAGDAALLVDAEDEFAIRDAILHIAKNYIFSSQLAELGYNNVRRFSWKSAAEQTLTVLEKATTA